MSRVITYSTVFPSYHPRKGDSTYFVEKIWNSINIPVNYKLICDINPNVPIDIIWNFWTNVNHNCKEEKGHTIRAGHRWKVGDWFSPRVWSGKPYNSKQIIIGPDIQIKKIWDLDIHGSDFYIDGKHEMTHPEGWDFDKLAKNDGLASGDLFDWFCLSTDFKRREQFFGQVLCWNENINY